VETALDYAKTFKCPNVNCLIGITPKDVPIDKARQTLVSNLRWAATEMEKASVRLLVEALNNQDFPNFYLTHTRDAMTLIEEVGHKNLFFQYDIYHMQKMEGDLTKNIRDNLQHIAHIQLADNPGRHEPGTGEINFPNLFKFIDEAGYNGWIGAEYRPTGVTEED